MRMERHDWTLLVIAAADGRALSPVQLQKVLFLLGKDLGLDGGGYYNFHAYDYGPFDVDVYRDAERLAARGLVTIEHGAYKTFTITGAGKAKAAEVGVALNEPARGFVRELVAWALRQSFQDIVKAVYRRFPEMRQNSVFRG
jgi:hypothetical protein